MLSRSCSDGNILSEHPTLQHRHILPLSVALSPPFSTYLLPCGNSNTDWLGDHTLHTNVHIVWRRIVALRYLLGDACVEHSWWGWCPSIVASLKGCTYHMGSIAVSCTMNDVVIPFQELWSIVAQSSTCFSASSHHQGMCRVGIPWWTSM